MSYPDATQPHTAGPGGPQQSGAQQSGAQQSGAQQGEPSRHGGPLKLVLTEQQWRERLGELEYHVLRESGTEPPFTGEYTDTETEGVYRCRACNAELFRSSEKFHSHCGWPSFFAPLAEERVRYLEDHSIPGRPRVEVRCASCESHLGHVFQGEGYETPTDLRYCINSVCLTLEETTLDT